MHLAVDATPRQVTHSSRFSSCLPFLYIKPLPPFAVLAAPSHALPWPLAALPLLFYPLAALLPLLILAKPLFYKKTSARVYYS
jgi:hypothetical protein